MTAPSLMRRARNTLLRPPSRRHGVIDVVGEGFVLTVRKRERTVRWADITQIDAGIRDYLNFDGLYVHMFVVGVALEIDELDDGFRQFEAALFERWPQIRDPLNSLLAGNPHEPQHKMLWRR